MKTDITVAGLDLANSAFQVQGNGEIVVCRKPPGLGPWLS